MGIKSKINRTIVYAKSLPKSVWIVAVILPGGFTAIGTWLLAKEAVRAIRRKK